MKANFTMGPAILRLRSSFLSVVLVLFFTSARSANPESKNHVGTIILGHDMITPRAGHTASIMPDLKVLLAGGRDQTGVLATTEIYDPTSQTFAPGFKLNVAREDHIAATLGDGKTLIAGGRGRDGSALASTEDYDFENAKSSYRGNMHARRIHPCATMLLDGRVLVTGGDDGKQALDSAETYNLLNGEWTLVGRMSVARDNHTATLLNDGRVLLTGGKGLQHEALNSAEIFDPHTNKFTTIANLHQGRFGHAAARLLTGDVLIAGGARGLAASDALTSAEIFQTRTLTFLATGDSLAPHPSALPNAFTLFDGEALILGGATTAEVFDARAGSFRSVPGAFDSPLTRSTAVQLSDGSVRIFGGAAATGTSSPRSWIYKP